MSHSISTKLRSFGTGIAGVTMLEYGIIGGLIAAVCIGTIQILGPQVNALFASVLSAFS